MIAFVVAAFANPIGQWAYVGGQAELTKRDAAVEEAAQRFNFMIRGVVRGKIAKACIHDTAVAFKTEGQTLVAEYEGGNQRTTRGPHDNSVFILDGANVQFDLGPEKLVVYGATDQGSKRSVYVTDGDTMSVTHTVAGKQLGDPIVWTLTYKRR